MRFSGAFVLTTFLHLLVVVTAGCPCEQEHNCDHPVKDLGHDAEVYVFSRGTTDVHLWNWNTITTLVVPSDFNISNKQQANTMCIAHSKGRKFGIAVDMTLSGELNETSQEAKDWIKSVITKQSEWRAEVIVIDLLSYFQSDVHSTEQDHIALIHMLSQIKKEIDEVAEITVQMSCIVPWKPPCAESEASCDFSYLSHSVCDFYIISPDSFTDLDDVKCRATATIPFSKLLYGISEYNAQHITSKRMILGIPWHGYDFTCSKWEEPICTLEEKTPDNVTQQCSFSNRKRLSMGEIFTKFPNEKDRQHSDLYNAPHCEYMDGPIFHQVWFEDSMSLGAKYKLVSELQLKGVGIMYGDDLSPDTNQNVLVNDDMMWTWLNHEVILAMSKKPFVRNMHQADTVAGVAVGCLIVGVCLGAIFTFIALRARVKKPKQPFLRDADTGVDEFTDEDPNL